MKPITEFLINNHVQQVQKTELFPHIEEYANTYNPNDDLGDLDESAAYIANYLGVKPSEEIDTKKTDIINILFDYYKNYYPKGTLKDPLKDRFMIDSCTIMNLINYKLELGLYNFILFCVHKELSYK